MIFDNLQRAMVAAFAAFCVSGLIAISVKESMKVKRCEPVKVGASCRLSRYEVRVHDVTERSFPTIGLAEGACVYKIGTGIAERYVMPEATFSAANRTDYFDKGVEIPVAQAEVCEVLA
jgi:hypothetical protein